MSQTRIKCQKCGFPQVHCKCKHNRKHEGTRTDLALAVAKWYGFDWDERKIYIFEIRKTCPSKLSAMPINGYDHSKFIAPALALYELVKGKIFVFEEDKD